MAEYTRLFQSQFWDNQICRFGLDAMKITSRVLPAIGNLDDFRWAHAQGVYGTPASDWMQHAWERLRDENGTEMLWSWLFWRTVDGCAASRALGLWRTWLARWAQQDRYAWVTGTTVAAYHDAMVTAIDRGRAQFSVAPFPGTCLEGFCPSSIEAVTRLG